jgi:hypothetical protein
MGRACSDGRHGPEPHRHGDSGQCECLHSHTDMDGVGVRRSLKGVFHARQHQLLPRPASRWRQYAHTGRLCICTARRPSPPTASLPSLSGNWSRRKTTEKTPPYLIASCARARRWWWRRPRSLCILCVPCFAFVCVCVRQPLFCDVLTTRFIRSRSYKDAGEKGHTGRTNKKAYTQGPGSTLLTCGAAVLGCGGGQ